MKLAFNIPPKAASALTLMMALGTFATPISGIAQETQGVDCLYKKTAQVPEAGVALSSPLRAVPAPVQETQTVPPDAVSNATVLTAVPVDPQPLSTVMNSAVKSGPASADSPLVAPHLSTETVEAGQLLDKPVRIAQAEAVAATTKSAKQDTMKVKSKMTPDKPDLWRNVLVNHTNRDMDGLVRFDYAGLKAAPNDLAALSRYIDELAVQKPSTFGRNDAMVYWANLYNALTVQIVAENYPVKSIRKIKSGFLPGPWKKDLVTVEGESLSLDNIEHDIMRPTYQTPLVHYMVNCASVGCPNLKETPWQAATLDADLETAARDFINSPRGVMTNKGRLQVSSIYKWFQKDFGGTEKGVLEHMAQYAHEDIAAKLLGRTKIDKFDYDWGVNAP